MQHKFNTMLAAPEHLFEKRFPCHTPPHPRAILLRCFHPKHVGSALPLLLFSLGMKKKKKKLEPPVQIEELNLAVL